MADAARQEGPTHETSLRIERTIAAPPERVFEAWTSPEALKAWWLPTDEHAVTEARVDLRVGGAYEIRMRAPSSREYVLSGTYREVSPPERLVYTWGWSHDPDSAATLVTVDFLDRGEKTLIRILHEGFADSRARDLHVEGWSGCLDHLPRGL